MVTSKTVTIKGLRLFGGVITWCYDNPQQARRPWQKICETGRTPDTNERLINACYFLGESNRIHKQWCEPQDQVLGTRFVGK